MSLNLKYFRNLWDGKWVVKNTATGEKIVIENGQTYMGTFPLANTGTTFSFLGTDPRQTEWDEVHRMFTLVTNEEEKELVIKWENGSGIPQAKLFFSGDAGGEVFLTLEKEKSGVLGLIVDHGKIGEPEITWTSYYDKCPAPKLAAPHRFENNTILSHL